MTPERPLKWRRKGDEAQPLVAGLAEESPALKTTDPGSSSEEAEEATAAATAQLEEESPGQELLQPTQSGEEAVDSAPKPLDEEELYARIAAAGASTVAAWKSEGGPSFGLCAVCFQPLVVPVVMPCGHAVCNEHVQPPPRNRQGHICRWAPACAEQSFPNGFGNRKAPCAASVVQAVIAHCPRPDPLPPPSEDGEAPDLASNAKLAAAVQTARSPLEAIKAYRALADSCEKKECMDLGLAAVARLKAIQIQEEFEVPAPMMASRIDQLRHGVLSGSAARSSYGEVPQAARDKAAALLKRTRGSGCNLEVSIDGLPVPTGPGSVLQAIEPPAANDALDELQASVECAVCYATLYEPVTVACGHTFCRRCLARQLDFDRGCPLCREQLAGFIDGYPVTRSLGEAIERLFPGSAAHGQSLVEQEVNDMRDWLPIFVCMVAVPTQECPLHIFEPRYRLMMRRAVSSGIRRFGMCVPLQGPPGAAQNGYSTHGTTLFIREMRMLPDGRSLVDCIGESRFKVKECSERDGYNVARVEPIVEQDEVGEEFLSRCRSSFEELRQKLLQKFGARADLGAVPDLGKGRCSNEEADDFYWAAVTGLPVGDNLKWKALATEGRIQRFKFLDKLLKAVLSHLAGQSAVMHIPGDGDDEDEHEEEAEEAEEERENNAADEAEREA